MQRRLLQATVASVVVAILLIGVPIAVFSAVTAYNNIDAGLELRTQAVARDVEDRVAVNAIVTETTLEPWVTEEGSRLPVAIDVTQPRGSDIALGPEMPANYTVTKQVTTASGAVVTVSHSGIDVAWRIAQIVLLVALLSIVAAAAAVALARAFARRLAAPLIYLAASAEQLGSGQVRPRMKDSGIEEIDLVADELARTSDRLASRLAAERQFSADASHQLRTPLTALSMRLEEIELMSKDPEVSEEARIALEQVERLVGVVDDLLSAARRQGGGTTAVVSLADVFEQQETEWVAQFAEAGREVVFVDPGSTAVLATPGGLAQVLATLVENSLKYGDGTTTITTRGAGSRNSVVIEVRDEGDGVAEDLAPRIFEKHVSGGQSTGLGLALARDLVAADGGKLELAKRVPATFQIFLSAVPTQLDPDQVLPPGALVAVGRRRRRL